MVTVVGGRTANRDRHPGTVGGVGDGVELRRLALGKTYGFPGPVGWADQLQAGDVGMGIHRYLVTGESSRGGRHVGDACFVGRDAGRIRGDRRRVVVPRSAADRAGGGNVCNGAVGGAVGIGAHRGRASVAVLRRRGLQLCCLRVGYGEPGRLGLQADRNRLALDVAIANAVAVFRVFVSAALQRKPYGNTEKK
jgi:hypothetical protein